MWSTFFAAAEHSLLCKLPLLIWPLPAFRVQGPVSGFAWEAPEEVTSPQQQTHRKGILLNKITYTFSHINSFRKKSYLESYNFKVGSGIQEYSWRFWGENGSGMM